MIKYEESQENIQILFNLVSVILSSINAIKYLYYMLKIII